MWVSELQKHGGDQHGSFSFPGTDENDDAGDDSKADGSGHDDSSH